MRICFVILLFSSFDYTVRTASAAEPTLEILGFLEDAVIYPEGLQFRAKLDSGADTSSVHAEGMRYFEKDDRDWVSFTVVNRYGEPERIERAVQRFAAIKSKRGTSQRRPVVRLGFCVSEIFEVVEVTLVDRSNFSSEVLVGRNFLAGKILVDSSLTFTTHPNCSERAMFK
jgi:hypothetical protein